jgi:hypothetical protein
VIYIVIYMLIATIFGLYLPSYVYEMFREEMEDKHSQSEMRDIAFYTGFVCALIWPIVTVDIIFYHIRKKFK